MTNAIIPDKQKSVYTTGISFEIDILIFSVSDALSSRAYESAIAAATENEL